MLIDSRRLTAADRAAWERLERFDARLARDPRLDRQVQVSLDAIRGFLDAGDAVVSTSWGKDSVVAAHLATLVRPDITLVWARARDVETPETELVRDRFLATHPGVGYEERLFEFRVPLRGEPGHETAPRQDALGETLHGRHISGVRGEESRVRRISIAHRGLSTGRVCRPLGRWDAVAVFAYLYREGLPVHPVYGMSVGGRYDRRWLRVHPLGTAGPARSAVHGWDMASWEDTYFGDVLADARRARASMWAATGGAG